MKEQKTFGKMVVTVAALCASMAMADGVKTAHWTGGGDRSNVNDPMNWAVTDSQGVKNAVPDAETDIVISGETDFNCPLGQTLTYKSIEIGDCTLTADCDWRGLVLQPSPTYIDVPNGAYVDTGFKPNQDTRVVMDVTVQGTNEYWCGAWDINWDNRTFAFCNDGSGVYTAFVKTGSANNGTTGTVVPNGRHVLDFDKGVFKVDGTTHTSRSADGETYQWIYPLYLFAQNRKGAPTSGKNQGAIRFHSCQIYDNGELVRDYVPTNNGTAFGLYDRKNGTFSGTSDASRPFTGETATVEINGTVDLSGFSLAIADTAGSGTITDTAGYLDIPKGYYLDTGFAPSNNTRVVLDVTVQGALESWFGVSDEDSGHWYHRKVFSVANDGKGVFSGFGDEGGTGNSNDGRGVVENGRHTIDFNKGALYIDGGKEENGGKVANYTHTASNFQLSNSLYLFADNKAGKDAIIKDAGHRFHSCQIYNGEDLVHDYIPAKRKTEYGIYDRVDRAFKSLSIWNTVNGELAGDVAKGTLRIDVCAGRTVENSTLTITGTLKLVKDGEGTLISAREKQSYTGGTFVDKGLVKCNRNVGNTPWGPSKSLITVEDGAAFDYAGACSRSSTPYSFSIKGAGTDGKGALLNSAGSGDIAGFWCQNIIADLELRGDATIRGCASFGFSLNENYTSGTYNHELGLNGYTLSIFLNSNSSDNNDGHQLFAFRGVQAIGGGTIIMRNESSSKVTFPSFYGAPSDLSGVTFDLGEGMGINVEAVPTVGTFIDRRTTVGRDEHSSNSIIVLDTYKPMTTGLLKTVTLGDSTHLSPVLDLSGIEGPFDLTAADPESTIGAAEGATVKVKLGDRKTSGSTPIITWEGNRPTWVDTLRFARGDADRKYGLRVGDNGIYAVVGFTIVFY